MSAGSRDDRARDHLERLLAPVVEDTGFDLEEVAVSGGGQRVVRVVIDVDGGVSLDGITAMTKAVSAVLDSSDAMGERPYILEVTSPGVDRPLTEPRHWRRSVGRLVRVSLAAGGELEGRVLAVDDDAVTLDARGEERRLGFGELHRGRVQVELRRDDGDEG